MKIIDLLNKIANGEEVPHYINYTHKAFGKDTMMVCKENIINKLDIGAIELNDEVEIIEEDKKIKKICTFTGLDDDDYAYEDGNIPNNVKINNMMELLLINKLNEIIDYIIIDYINGSDKE